MLMIDTYYPYSFLWNTTSSTNSPHTLQAVAYDFGGNRGISSPATVNVYNNDRTPPSAPQNLSATVVSTTRVDLSWDASTDGVGVAGYNVYRSGMLIATVMTTNYSAINLAQFSSHTFTVAAFDATGNTSGQSVGVTIFTDPPPTVRIFSPLPGDTVFGTTGVSVLAYGSNFIASRVEL